MAVTRIANPFASSTPVGGELQNLVSALYSGNPMQHDLQAAHAERYRQQNELTQMQIEKAKRDAAAAANPVDPLHAIVSGIYGDNAGPVEEYVRNRGIAPSVAETEDRPALVGGYGTAKPPVLVARPEDERMLMTQPAAIIASRLLPGKTTYEQVTKGIGETQQQDAIAKALDAVKNPVAGPYVAKGGVPFHFGAQGQVGDLTTGTQDQTSPLALANIGELKGKTNQANAAAGASTAAAARTRAETLPVVEIPSPTAGQPPVKVVGRDYGKAVATAQTKPTPAAGITDEGLMPMAWDALLFGKNPPGMGNLAGAQRAMVANKRAQIGHGLGLSDPEIAMLPNDNKIKNKAYGNAVNWGATVDRSAGVLNDSLDAAIETAKKLPLSTIQAVTKGVLAGMTQFNDPDANVYASQLMTIRREYGRLVTGPTSNAMLPVEAMKQADNVLSTGVDLPSLEGVGNWFKREAAITQHNTSRVIEGLRGSMLPAGAPTGSATSATSATPPPKGVKFLGFEQ